jgi:hypothetical protein
MSGPTPSTSPPPMSPQAANIHKSIYDALNPALRGVAFLVALIGVVTIGFGLLAYSLWRPEYASGH